ncbi:alkaline phosphatase family protein [Nocardioides sp.]|uniref:alkaline phosphatase family protein n=1 Tax=Nocardioides sp. TaxID=35761 RepID=UPI00239DF600|nr:alkaline phosphatase family protein [Nocardioides sp.]MDE0777728.1 alkaline phosphatase family protein [Nocardioides sp.]
MCESSARRRDGEPTPYDVGLAEIAAGRRTVLKLGGAGLVFSSAAAGGALGTDAAAAAGKKLRKTKKRAYVLVVDGCLPEEIDSGLTPNLAGLRDGGFRYSRAASKPIMETIPNHVMMMTGVRPDRSGVPANSIYDRKEKVIRDLDRPRDLKADTIIERMNRRGLRTGTVLSKEYLYGIFGTRATDRWEPRPIVPVSGHAPDIFTMEAALAMLDELDPHLMFVNLGDVDRLGHTDFTGPSGVQAARRLGLIDTDLQVGRFIAALRASGRWEHSMVIVLADHSMDFSRPDRVVSLQGPFEDDPFLAGKFVIADNGGADLVYWTGPDRQREKAVKKMRRIAREVPGVLNCKNPQSSWMRLGPEAGDLVVFCKSGWRFSDPDPVTSNPIPGNHGHPATRPIPFFISGGHPRIPRRKASSKVAHTVDVAPTVADFFGIKGKPRGGYDGRSRL